MEALELSRRDIAQNGRVDDWMHHPQRPAWLKDAHRREGVCRGRCRIGVELRNRGRLVELDMRPLDRHGAEQWQGGRGQARETQRQRL